LRELENGEKKKGKQSFGEEFSLLLTLSGKHMKSANPSGDISTEQKESQIKEIFSRRRSANARPVSEISKGAIDRLKRHRGGVKLKRKGDFAVEKTARLRRALRWRLGRGIVISKQARSTGRKGRGFNSKSGRRIGGVPSESSRSSSGGRFPGVS